MTFALVTQKPSDAEFLTLFNRLSVALREQQDESGVTQGVYFDALKDLPIRALEAGAAALMKEPGRRFFPTTAEWRTAAEKATVAQLREAVQPRPEDRGVFICRACFDTGWESGPSGDPLECPGDARCGRRNEHGKHTYTRACPCRETNANYQRAAHFGAGR